MKPICKTEARFLWGRNDGRNIHTPVAGFGRYYKREMTRARRRFFAAIDRRALTQKETPQ